MLNKLASIVLVTALVCALGGTSAFANSASDPEAKPKAAETPSADTAKKTEVQPNTKLRADVLKLVTEAKAGKLKLAERPQIQPARSNNLSKGTKIAIGVGIAVAVIAIILVVHTRNHLFDGFSAF